MATVKVKFRLSSPGAGKGTLYYQVSHHRVVRRINSGCDLFVSEWDNEKSCVLTQEGDDSRRTYLRDIERRLETDIIKLKDIVRHLEMKACPYTTDKVVELFRHPIVTESFFAFMELLISEFRQVGRVRTAETYASALNSFMRFREGLGDIYLDDLNSTLMLEYEAYLKASGMTRNTMSFYMRNLRAAYNRAVDKELTRQRYPFKHVYTGVDKTLKRAVSIETVRRIRDLDLSSSPSMDFARDVFMFSFYTRGMSFVDMAYLRKQDLCNGILTYRRRKTRQQLFIKWEHPMQEIVNKYDTSSAPYLLPIIRDTAVDERRQYRNAVHLVNEKLKRIGILLGIPVTLTTYVARHAWASIAKSKNISLSVISEAMGHDSEKTTRIYLASLDTSPVDLANSLVINSL